MFMIYLLWNARSVRGDLVGSGCRRSIGADKRCVLQGKRAGEPGACEAGSVEVDAAQVGVIEVRAAHIGLAEIGAAQVGGAQIGALNGVTTFTTPFTLPSCFCHVTALVPVVARMSVRDW